MLDDEDLRSISEMHRLDMREQAHIGAPTKKPPENYKGVPVPSQDKNSTEEPILVSSRAFKTGIGRREQEVIPIDIFLVSEHGTLSLQDYEGPDTRMEAYGLSSTKFTTRADLASEACIHQSVLAQLYEIYLVWRDESIERLSGEDADGIDSGLAEFESKWCSDFLDDSDNVITWLDQLTNAQFLKTVESINRWGAEVPEWDEYEDVLVPLNGQDMAYNMFRGCYSVMAGELGVYIVEGDHPFSTYFAAELSITVAEANQKAVAADINIRFKPESEELYINSGDGGKHLPPVMGDLEALDGKWNHTWPEGHAYEGDWVDGLQHGKGKMIWPDGEVYEGDWVDGREQGKGTHTWLNGGPIYEGDWVEGSWHGKGTYICPDGWRYKGDFIDGFRHGKGTHTWPDGVVYTGDWVNGMPNGIGTITWPAGEIYEGAWLDGSWHGWGKHTSSDGEVCEGEWVDHEFLG